MIAGTIHTRPSMQAITDRIGTVALLAYLCNRVELAGDLFHLQYHLFGGSVLPDPAIEKLTVHLDRIRTECAEYTNDAMRQ